MSAPTSANPHMKEPHTDTSRRRLCPSGWDRTAAWSTTRRLQAAKQRQSVPREPAVVDDSEVGRAAEPVVDGPGAHLPDRSRAVRPGTGIVDRCAVHQAEIPPRRDPPNHPGRDIVELAAAHIVEELRTEDEVKSPAGVRHPAIKRPDLHPGGAGQPPAGTADRQARKVQRDDM